MLHVPGGQKRKSDFHTEAEWKAYKAERDAKAAARVEEWHTRERAAELAAFKEWEAERITAAAELLSAWESLYAGAIATNDLGLVRAANRLHRATHSVLRELVEGDRLEDRWSDIDDSDDPLYNLPELLERAVLGEDSMAKVNQTADDDG